jgi:hypothetical protein
MTAINIFQAAPGVEGADAIRALIAALPQHKRSNASDFFEELVKSKSLKGLEHLLAGESEAGPVIVEKVEEKAKGKVKPELTDKAKLRKAATAYKKMLVVGLIEVDWLRAIVVDLISILFARLT